MARLTTKLMIATAAVLATAGCATKRQEALPPAPVGTQAPGYQDTAPTTTGVEPGSAADFLRSVTSDTIHFALDQFDIDPEARAVLDSQSAWLAKYPDVRVTIEGHCDERGTREYNLALGDRRSNAAKNYLASRGVSPARITTISYGKERPIALGSDDASWAQNRRAVTIVVK